jgi:hypothetical protein
MRWLVLSMQWLVLSMQWLVLSMQWLVLSMQWLVLSMQWLVLSMQCHRRSMRCPEPCPRVATATGVPNFIFGPVTERGSWRLYLDEAGDVRGGGEWFDASRTATVPLSDERRTI